MCAPDLKALAAREENDRYQFELQVQPMSDVKRVSRQTRTVLGPQGRRALAEKQSH
jgi:hypothetical protein